MEVVASKISGRLNLAVNGQMLDRNLVDQVLSNIISEVQEIAINSTIVQESFVKLIFILKTLNEMNE